MRRYGPHLTPGQVVSRSLAGAREREGGKAAAARFDNLNGDEVTEQTYSRLERRTRSFDVDNLPALVAMDHEVGRWLLHMVPLWMGLDERVVQALPAETARKVLDAYRDVVVAEVAPGKWGRR